MGMRSACFVDRRSLDDFRGPALGSESNSKVGPRPQSHPVGAEQAIGLVTASRLPSRRGRVATGSCLRPQPHTRAGASCAGTRQQQQGAALGDGSQHGIPLSALSRGSDRGDRGGRRCPAIMEGRRSPQRSEPPGNRSDGASVRAALAASPSSAGGRAGAGRGRPDDEPSLSFAISRLGAPRRYHSYQECACMRPRRPGSRARGI